MAGALEKGHTLYWLPRENRGSWALGGPFPSLRMLEAVVLTTLRETNLRVVFTVFAHMPVWHLRLKDSRFVLITRHFPVVK